MTPNGCGPWWLPQKYKDDYFIDACTIHDKEYIEGADREKSDRDFYERMKQTIRDDITLSWIERKARYSQAWFYYHIVRKLGWLSHKKGLDL